MYLDFSCNPHINNTVITGNVAYEAGGGIAADGGSYVIMSNPTLSLNEAKWEGGALYVGSGGSVVQGFYVTNAVFDSNIAEYGFADVWLWPNKTYESVETRPNPTEMPTGIYMVVDFLIVI